MRKALSKLRQALREAKADAHLLIIRGGSTACPEYTLLLRWPKSYRRLAYIAETTL